MSVDNAHAAKYQPPAPEPEEPLPHTQAPLQPQVAPVEAPIIIWRSLMLEQ